MTSRSKEQLTLTGYFSGWSLYFTTFWFRVIQTNHSGDVIIFNRFMWADWPIHFTMGSSMAYRQLFLTTSPLLINAPFNYPYACNLLSAILIRCGVPFFSAFIFPSFIFSLFTIATLFFFYKTTFKSNNIAMLASFIFLLSGGLGFLQKFTQLDDMGIRWTSFLDTMFFPQRSLQHGLPVALLALTWAQQRKKMMGAGLLLGILPVLHIHSFLAAGIILFCWMIGDLVLKENLKEWLTLSLTTLVVSIPILIKTVFSSGAPTHFIHWLPGWYAADIHMNWFSFWWVNWGLTPWMAMLGFGLLRYKTDSPEQRIKTLALFLPFFILFALINLFRFQPYIWDNTKLLIWASIGFSGLAAHAVYWMWRFKNRKISAACVFVVLIFSGGTEAIELLNHSNNTFTLYKKEEMQLAEWVKKNTPVDSIWLTGDRHNHWLYNLTGRQVLMTYNGWLWSHGYDYKQIGDDVTALYINPAQNRDLFKKYGINNVVVGEDEIKNRQARPEEFQKCFKTIFKTETVSLFSKPVVPAK